ncbi:MAG: hypothetical protein K8R53_11415 [Bacteroidales bacterium]|nr:hypothetical protein [Bacteroidales bacterium]
MNYRWDLLSDLCFFSYEVDPATGDPVTTHNYLNDPVIDTALANGTRVHLCITLFSGHGSFFSNSSAQDKLIDNIIYYMNQRNAIGVNIDFEAMSSSHSNSFTCFMIDLCDAVHTTIAGSIVSIATPAVDWSETFNLQELKEYVDFFMVMGYDYYWNGSSIAGPVSPLYCMTSGYDYNLSMTLSYYQSIGVTTVKLIIGIPYF